jgi:hypothetical protein
VSNPPSRPIHQASTNFWWHPFSYQEFEKDCDLAGLNPEARMLAFGISELAYRFGRITKDTTELSRMLNTHRNKLEKYFPKFIGKFVEEVDGFLIPTRTPPGFVVLPELANTKNSKVAKEIKPPPPPPKDAEPPEDCDDDEEDPGKALIDILGMSAERYCRLPEYFMNYVISACNPGPKSNADFLTAAKLYRDAVLGGEDPVEIHRALAETHPGLEQGTMTYPDLIRWFKEHYPD